MRRIFLSTVVLAICAKNASAFTQVPQPARIHPFGVAQKQTKTIRPPSKPLQVADSAILAGIDAFWQNSPYTAAALVCGLKASMADIVAQIREFRKSPEEKMADLSKKVKTEKSTGSLFLRSTDWKRNVAFVTYGALYQGMTQEYIFNHLYPVWFGFGTDVRTVLTKVIFTLLVTTTTLTLPSLYVSKAFIEGYSLKQAAKNYISDLRYEGLLQKFYFLWGPVLTLTFSVIPEHYRVTFIAVVSFFWLILLSRISGDS